MGKDIKLILPGECNAKCDFCFAKNEVPTCADYGDRFEELFIKQLSLLPDEFDTVNITGGEPFLSPYIDKVCSILRSNKHLFKNIYMTTNGSNFNLSPIYNLLDGINISRHHFNENINRSIFGTKNIPNTKKLKEIIITCNNAAIPVTISMTLTDKISTVQDILDMVDYCKKIGASSLKIRKDYAEDLSPSIFEESFNFIKPISSGSCPVCRTKTQIIRGLEVVWSTGVLEPSYILKDEIFELIFQPSGDYTLDYKGKKKFPDSTTESIKSRIEKEKHVGISCHTKRKNTSETNSQPRFKFVEDGCKYKLVEENLGCKSEFVREKSQNVSCHKEIDPGKCR